MCTEGLLAQILAAGKKKQKKKKKKKQEKQNILIKLKNRMIKIVFNWQN